MYKTNEFDSDHRMVDFNVDSLKDKNDSNTADYFDKIYSSSFVPEVTKSTRLSPRSKTLIDNFFTTGSTEHTTSGNILTIVSDHLAQFILFFIAQFKLDKKMGVYERSFKNFRPHNFR